MLNDPAVFDAGDIWMSGETSDMYDVRETLLAKQQELQDRSADLTAPPDASGSISFGKRVGDGTSMAVERITQVAAH